MPRIFNLIGRGFFFFFFFCLVLNKTGQAVLGLWLRLWPTGWVLLHVLTKTLKLWCVLLSHIHTHNLCVCLCVCVCVCERDRESQCLSLQKCPSCFSILNLISKNKKPSRQPPPHPTQIITAANQDLWLYVQQVKTAPTSQGSEHLAASSGAVGQRLLAVYTLCTVCYTVCYTVCCTVCYTVRLQPEISSSRLDASSISNGSF